MRKLQAIGQKILVKVIEDPDVQGGIVILDSQKDLPQRGTVVSVGQGGWINGKLRPLDYQLGEVVIFHKYSGIAIQESDGHYLILKDEDVLAKE